MDCENCKKLKERIEYLESLHTRKIVGLPESIDFINKEIENKILGQRPPWYGLDIVTNVFMPKNLLALFDKNNNLVSIIKLKEEENDENN